MRPWRWLTAVALVLILAACAGTSSPPGSVATRTSSAAHAGLAAVRHVWVIELENQGYAQSFGPRRRSVPGHDAAAHGRPAGKLLLTGHSSLDNYIAQVSGRARTWPPRTTARSWFPFAGQVAAGRYHQVLGQGCVYPAAVQTLGNQLSAAGRSWTAYLQDMGNDPARDKTVSTARGPACGHPATWAIDHTAGAEQADQYAARHERFMYFRSVTGNQAFCDAHILSFRPLPGIWRGPALRGVFLHLAGSVQ